MNPQEYREWSKEEAKIGACWLVVLIGAAALAGFQWNRSPSIEDPLTLVTTLGWLVIVVASLTDDVFFRGKRNRKIRAAHKHLR